MVKKITSKSTKAEILEAFQEVNKEKSVLESEIKKLTQSTQSVAKPAPSTSSSKGTEPMKVSRTAQYKMNQTLDSLAQVKVGFGGAVSDLSEQLTAEAFTLGDVQTLVTEELESLNKLHGLEEVEEDTLDELIECYEESYKSFEEEESQKRETLEQEVQELRKSWRKEEETHQREIKERNETHHKSRQRDAEEYGYNLELERQLDTEEYEVAKTRLYKELAEAKLEQEKAWDEREIAIADREKAYAAAKEKVEAFPEELDKNINNGKDNGRNIGTYQAKVKADLRSKDIEGQKRNYELRIESLEQTIDSQNTRLQSLSKQLDAALNQVQDLAVKAIEGASNVSSFQTVKEILLEQQNKNQQKGK